MLSALHYYAEHRADVDAIREKADHVPEEAITAPDDIAGGTTLFVPANGTNEPGLEWD